MATFPYIPSVKSISDALTGFRRALPPVVDSDTLKKLGIAPNNESALISILQFLQLIGDDGKAISANQDIFYCPVDSFGEKLSERIQAAYSELFSLYGEDTWNLSQDKLVGFFRQSDRTSEITGQRQAKTFVALAELTGGRSVSVAPKAERAPSKPKGKATTSGSGASQPKTERVVESARSTKPNVVLPANGMALSVRIEVNLPATADQTVYDNIFRSIREHLID